MDDPNRPDEYASGLTNELNSSTGTGGALDSPASFRDGASTPGTPGYSQPIFHSSGNNSRQPLPIQQQLAQANAGGSQMEEDIVRSYCTSQTLEDYLADYTPDMSESAVSNNPQPSDANVYGPPPPPDYMESDEYELEIVKSAHAYMDEPESSVVMEPVCNSVEKSVEEHDVCDTINVMKFIVRKCAKMAQWIPYFRNRTSKASRIQLLQASMDSMLIVRGVARMNEDLEEFSPLLHEDKVISLRDYFDKAYVPNGRLRRFYNTIDASARGDPSVVMLLGVIALFSGHNAVVNERDRKHFAACHDSYLNLLRRWVGTGTMEEMRESLLGIDFSYLALKYGAEGERMMGTVITAFAQLCTASTKQTAVTVVGNGPATVGSERGGGTSWNGGLSRPPSRTIAQSPTTLLCGNLPVTPVGSIEERPGTSKERKSRERIGLFSS